MAAPNLQTATIQAASDEWAATNTITTRITCASNTSVLIKSIRATNIHASVVGWATVIRDVGGTDYRVGFQVNVPLNSTVELVTGILTLDDGDLLQLQANASSNIEFVTSYFIAS